jgi:hypothetical protein
MSKPAVLVIVFGLIGFASHAQDVTPAKPDSPTPTQPVTDPADFRYKPPTQSERFNSYVRHTFRVASILEARVRGGIE